MSDIQLSDPRLVRALVGAAKWSRILAIISLVLIGLFSLAMLLAFGAIVAMLSTQPQFAGLAAIGTVPLAVLFGVYLAIFAYLAYLGLRFGTALRADRDRVISNAAIEEGFGHLARFFLVSLVLIVLGFVGALAVPLLMVSSLG